MNETLAALDALPDFRSRPVSGQAELNALVAEPAVQANRYGLISAGSYVLGESSGAGIPAEELQPLLDRFLEASRKELTIDYIHGEDALFKLMEQKDGPPKTGILLPPFKKSGLFETIARSGPLPRKSFSMGEAREKRFYFECRRLFG